MPGPCARGVREVSVRIQRVCLEAGGVLKASVRSWAPAGDVADSILWGQSPWSPS